MRGIAVKKNGQNNARKSVYLLLNLQCIYDRSQLAENLVGFLMILQLSGDQICQIP